jgi:glycosyltransferase involved in cell wall biosynthesis
VSTPLVSIVVPTYDRVGFVETAIASLLEQDYQELEVIVLDDGSHDETPALLSRIAERAGNGRFRWDRHDNVGQAATINRGFELARGDLLGYLSSDDYLLPGAISKLVAAAEEHPDADVVYAGYLVVDASDHVTDEIRVLEHTFVDALRWSLTIPGVGPLMRRRCYERIGGWDPQYRFTGDFEWWLRAGNAKFVRVPETLGAWRSHDGSITAHRPDIANIRERLDERLRILDGVFERDDLPPEVRAVRHEAYSTTLTEFGQSIAADYELPADRRFAVEDRVGPLISRRWDEGLREGLLWYAHTVRYLEHRAEAAASENAELRKAVAALERRAARPLWLRVARSLTPPPLRPRVATLFHRLRHLRHP